MQPTETRQAWIKGLVLEISRPSLKDNTADRDRLLKETRKVLGVGDVTMDLPLTRRLPSLLRESDFKVGVVLFRDGDIWRVMDLYPARKTPRLFGLAVDLGTSTVVIRLVDLAEGRGVDEVSFLNPQRPMGEDILSRIHFASGENGLYALHSALIKGINEKIGVLVRRHGLAKESLAGMVLAGNTTMTHLFLGLDPFWICREPYIPVVNRTGILRAEALGLFIHPNAPVLVFPNVGSYFGGDLIAGILASGMARRKEISLLVDVGTNAEVVLGNREWLMGCAGAAGPALEGGVASIGMMAGPGAIDRVRIDPDSGEPEIRTIGDQPPTGICGSGLIDLAAQLFLTGMIDLRGKFVKEVCGDKLREIDGIAHLVLVPAGASGTGEDLTLGQPDLDALIRSKAAMYTILVTITRMANLSFEEIHHFLVAGTFGTTIDPRSAITIGMLPDLPPDRFRTLGNTSLEGATLALLSYGAMEEAERIRDNVTYIELNVNQEFMNRFSAAKFIPHTDTSLFPSVKVARVSKAMMTSSPKEA